MIYVLIPVFNRLEQTQRCIQSILNQSIYSEISIVVVDDNSTDGTVEWLRTECLDVTILSGTGALFWCGAIHYGIEYILKKADLGDFVLLVNNDVELGNKTVEHLRDYITLNQRTVITGALAIDRSDRRTIIKSGSTVKNWCLNITEHVFVGASLDRIKKERPKRVDFITARCLLHPVEVFWQVGNYDAETFIHYGGDDEFSMRVKKYGIETHLLPSAVVFLDNPPGKTLNPVETLFGTRSSSNIVNKMRLSFRVAPMGRRTLFFLGGVIKSIVVALRNAV